MAKGAGTGFLGVLCLFVFTGSAWGGAWEGNRNIQQDAWQGALNAIRSSATAEVAVIEAALANLKAGKTDNLARRETKPEKFTCSKQTPYATQAECGFLNSHHDLWNYACQIMNPGHDFCRGTRASAAAHADLNVLQQRMPKDKLDNRLEYARSKLRAIAAIEKLRRDSPATDPRFIGDPALVGETLTWSAPEGTAHASSVPTQFQFKYPGLYPNPSYKVPSIIAKPSVPKPAAPKNGAPKNPAGGVKGGPTLRAENLGEKSGAPTGPAL